MLCCTLIPRPPPPPAPEFSSIFLVRPCVSRAGEKPARMCRPPHLWHLVPQISDLQEPYSLMPPPPLPTLTLSLQQPSRVRGCTPSPAGTASGRRAVSGALGHMRTPGAPARKGLGLSSVSAVPLSKPLTRGQQRFLRLQFAPWLARDEAQPVRHQMFVSLVRTAATSPRVSGPCAGVHSGFSGGFRNALHLPFVLIFFLFVWI